MGVTRIAVMLGLIMGSALAAQADESSTPVITAVQPNPLHAATGSLQISLYGHDLTPTPGRNPPDYSQYWHIFARTVGADGKPGAWEECHNGDCSLASGGDDMMTFKIDGGRWLIPGGHIQLHFWKGLALPGTADPSQNGNGTPRSGWSNVAVWDVAAPPPPPVAPPPPPAKPVLTRRAIPMPLPTAATP